MMPTFLPGLAAQKPRTAGAVIEWSPPTMIGTKSAPSDSASRTTRLDLAMGDRDIGQVAADIPEVAHPQRWMSVSQSGE